MLVLVSKEPSANRDGTQTVPFPSAEHNFTAPVFLAHLCSKIEIHIFLLIADPSHY